MMGGMPVRQQTLCFVFRQAGGGQQQVLLGRKNRGFGAGKVMGLGGHLDPGESELACAIREVREEAGLVLAPEGTSWRGAITFDFPTRPEWDAVVSVFFGEQWDGRVRASDEISPEWFDVDSLPFDRMWDDERYWLPRMLAGEKLIGAITYDNSGTLVAQAKLEHAQVLQHVRHHGWNHPG